MIVAVLVNAAIRMALVGAIAWLALRILRVRNPHAKVLVCRLLLLAGFALPALLYWHLAPSFITSLQLPVITVTGAGSGSAGASGTGYAALPLAVLTAIYLGVALSLLARLVAGLVAMRRVVRAASRMPLPGDVRSSAQVRSPATFGTIILLPPDAPAWPAERLDAVLTHERAHVRSRDSYWSWLAQLHAAIFWFNPIAWWVQRRLESLAETTSDDAVVGAHHDPVAYAALLLDFARHPNSRSVVMSVAESNVSRRIERLLARTPPARALPRVARWAALALLVPVVMMAAATTQAAPTAKTALPPAAGKQMAVLLKVPNPDDYFPAVALHERVTGEAVVEVDVDALGKLVDVRVVRVEPADPRFGFADAALRVAQDTTYGAPSRQPSTIRFMVKFALAD